jgi:hypothetical protein
LRFFVLIVVIENRALLAEALRDLLFAALISRCIIFVAHGFSYDIKSRLKDSFPFGGIVAELPRENRRYLT